MIFFSWLMSLVRTQGRYITAWFICILAAILIAHGITLANDINNNSAYYICIGVMAIIIIAIDALFNWD